MNPKAVKIGGESLLDRVLPHMKKILIAIGITTVVLTVIFTRRYFIERGEQKETFKLANVLQIASQPVRAVGDTLDPKNPTYADDKERADAVIAAATNQDVVLSPAYRGGMLMDQGKIDDAIAAYRVGIGADGIDGVLAREGLGIAQETKALAEKDAAAKTKGLEEALLTFESMQPDVAGPRYAYGQYHVGRMLALLGKTDEAKAALTKARDAAKGSMDLLPELIEKRLASLGA
nr:hypothetical protein [Kofleriaceae bacterium]